MLKGSFDAQLIFLSELNMRFDVTACACGVNQYPNSIYDTSDYSFCLHTLYDNSYLLLFEKIIKLEIMNKQYDLIRIFISILHFMRILY